MKLLLGCGKRKKKGWLGVDINAKVEPDIVDDMTKLFSIEPGSVEAIKSQYSFEHLTYESAIYALKNWFKVLKPGGELSIELPDLDKCYKMVKSSDLTERKYGFYGLFGSAANVYLMHKHAWDFKSLKAELKKYGFVNIRTGELERINKCKLLGYDRDIRVISNKRKKGKKYG